MNAAKLQSHTDYSNNQHKEELWQKGMFLLFPQSTRHGDLIFREHIGRYGFKHTVTMVRIQPELSGFSLETKLSNVRRQKEILE